ncbi:hypothetical protein [Salibacterium halotolerans]|uniref:Membrane protein involved in the export of O-antigen and teichoic acid n=1 Tax=Salibacterium halotolerans TaxID=1884432 RepID=A0A1I5PU21_9BACI|nr:hypothetical protein [Salibacterium halotolerans]SFP37434.1 hypothetical protein SAMN05518683_104226 [Salibacterium halotolerans]
MNRSEKDNQKNIWQQWMPLAFSTSILYIEIPVMLLLIARMPDGTENILAFNMGLGYIFILNSTVQFITSVSTKLSENFPSFYRVLLFSLLYSAAIVVIGYVCLFSPLFEGVFRYIVPINDPKTLELIKTGCLVLSTAPVAVAWRRVYQGLWIRREKTSVVTLASFIRLISGITIAGILFLLGIVDGVLLGALALVISAFIEAFVLTVWKTETKNELPAAGEKITFSSFWKSHFPLAVAALLLTLDIPLFLVGIGHAPTRVEESLVVWQIVLSFVYMVSGPLEELQNVTIHEGRNHNMTASLKRFSLAAGCFFSALLVIVASTPLGGWYYVRMMGLETHYSDLAAQTTFLLIGIPFLTSVLSVLRGRLVLLEKEKVVERVMYLNIGILALCLALLNSFSPLAGAYIAALALTTALIIQSLTLYGSLHRNIRKQ